MLHSQRPVHLCVAGLEKVWQSKWQHTATDTKVKPPFCMSRNNNRWACLCVCCHTANRKAVELHTNVNTASPAQPSHTALCPCHDRPTNKRTSDSSSCCCSRVNIQALPLSGREGSANHISTPSSTVAAPYTKNSQCHPARPPALIDISPAASGGAAMVLRVMPRVTTVIGLVNLVHVTQQHNSDSAHNMGWVFKQ